MKSCKTRTRLIRFVPCNPSGGFLVAVVLQHYCFPANACLTSVHSLRRSRIQEQLEAQKVTLQEAEDELSRYEVSVELFRLCIYPIPLRGCERATH